jgi:hypothetical protein
MNTVLSAYIFNTLYSLLITIFSFSAFLINWYNDIFLLLLWKIIPCSEQHRNFCGCQNLMYSVINAPVCLELHRHTKKLDDSKKNVSLSKTTAAIVGGGEIIMRFHVT